MPVDRKKNICFQILDRCFSDQQHKYFYKDLRKAVDEAMENEGYVSPGRSTLYGYIEELTNSLEYPGAELIDEKESTVGRSRYFRYKNPTFSIWQRSLDGFNLSQLQSILLMLRQFKGFPQYDAIEDIIDQIEKSYHISLADAEEVIAFESNENTDALSLVGTLFSHITHHQVLKVVYHPFQKDPIPYTIHPHFLKQYNRRWYLIGLSISEDGKRGRGVFALDRITSIEQLPDEYITSDKDLEELYDDHIGVTITKEEPVKIKLQFTPKRFQYVVSKPIHTSQHNYTDDCTVTIKVKPNKELFQTLLSFGSDVQVLGPAEVREKMREEINKMQNNYLSPENLDR